MYYIFAAVAAALIAIMVTINGNLTEISGMYAATVIIHVVGLTSISIILLMKRIRLTRYKLLPVLLYSGGAIGVATTLLNNAVYGHISVSAILALDLLAESVTSLFIDQYGLFGMPVKKINRAKILGFIFTIIGIVFLLKGSNFVFIPVLLSLLTGICVVTSRFANARLAEKTSVWVSTWYNYMIGLIFSLIVFAISRSAGISSSFRLSPRIWIYTGGIIGVCIIALSNMATTKMPAFILTLIMFIGQLFTGIVVDYIIGKSFSVSYVIGGIFAVFGLCLNLLIEYRHKTLLKKN